MLAEVVLWRIERGERGEGKRFRRVDKIQHAGTSWGGEGEEEREPQRERGIKTRAGRCLLAATYLSFGGKVE